MSAGLSSEERGLINTVELALDWQLPITDKMFWEYERLIDKRQQLEARRQQSGKGTVEVPGDCPGQQSGEDR